MEFQDNFFKLLKLLSLSLKGDGKNIQGKHNAHQGVGTERDNQVYKAYYQWVALFLFMQGVMFNVPHFLWTAWEGKKMDRITVTLKGW